MLVLEPVARDSDGDWTHPALTKLLGDREIVPADEWDMWLGEHGIEIQTSEMEYEIPADHPAWIRHYEQGNPGSLGWEPEQPGAEWHLLSIHDTEDGPIAIWYRGIAGEQEPKTNNGNPE
ncbi:hypothetical protein [Marinobacter sp. ELB17]|uniref:hypothetical protein n=1 Tax=Marinobacter sp. ELB17 TaxID=270374 RepID=UPI0000F39C6E|nr:hypothetical protein [Marinobacter sp. ELB17]EAZ97243.1 hypothetical protein MELB17_10138 [Marinobacter sp. ELB17]